METTKPSMSVPRNDRSNNNYIKLAQVYHIIKERSKSDQIIEKCLEDVNYQLPRTPYFENEMPDLIGSTALHLALELSDMNILKLLIDRGADVTIQNANGMTVLHQSMECDCFNFSTNNMKDYYKMEGKITHPRASLLLAAQTKSKNCKNPRNKFGLSHFHIACMLNDVEAVEFFLKNDVLIDQSVDADSPVLSGFTALHIAARYSSLDTVRMLVNNGANTHIRNTEGMTAMQIIIARNMKIMDWINIGKQIPVDGLKEELNGNEGIINFFLKHDNSDVIDGLSLFHVAATLQNTFTITRLLKQRSKEMDINHSVRNDSPVWPGYTALHFAAHCNVKIFKILLDNFKANLFVGDANGVTPFDLCLQRYEAESVLDCIESKPIWNEGIKFSGTKCKLSSFVHSMREKSTFEFYVRNLLKNINAQLPFDSPLWPGCTPLHLAVMFLERKEVAGQVDENPSNRGKTVYRNKSPNYNCTKAEESLYLDRITLCLNLGADVTAQDSMDSTPLHIAFKMQKRNAVELFLKFHRKIVDPVDLDGVSHLHIACAVGCNELAEQLLRSGADVNRPMNYSFKWNKNKSLLNPEVYHISVDSTPLHIAVASENVYLTDLLLKWGADLYAQDTNGMTPIHLVLNSRRYHKVLAKSLFARSELRECVANCGLTHLHVASYVQNANAAKALFKNGADVKATITYTRKSNESDNNESMDDDYFTEEELTAEPLAFLAPYSGCTPLHLAMKFDEPEDPLPSSMILNLKQQHKDFVQLLVRKGADILAKKPNGSTPLYYILSEKDDSALADFIVKTLVSKVTLQKRILKDHGLTMLHIACYLVDEKLIKKLLGEGMDVNARVHLNSPIWPGCTPLHILISRSRIYAGESSLQLLLDKGADVTLTDKKNSTPVHEAFAEKDFRALKTLLNYHKDFNLNPVNHGNVTHFHAACVVNAVECVKQFLNHKVDVNQFTDHFLDDYAGYTPLHVAVYKNCKETIHLLLQHGVDCSTENIFGETPLHVLVDEARITADLLKSFIAAGADINVRTMKGESLLETALKCFFTEKINDMVELLLEFGCRINDFNSITNEGYIAMGLKRCINAKIDKERLLMKTIMNARDINRVDKMGRTAVHNVVSTYDTSISSEQYTELIEDFAKNGCEIDYKDKRGQTALHFAVMFSNKNAIVGLLANGADVNITDDNGRSAFHDILESDYAMNKIFCNHIFKMRFHGLCLSKCNEELADEAEKKFSTQCDLLERLYFESLCSKELEKLKNTRIESLPLTLYEFVYEKFATITYYKMPQLQRRIIDQFFRTHSKHLRKEYPQLSSLLFLQYRKAAMRANLIELAKISLNILAEVDVPDLCSEMIFESLKHHELKILIASTDVQFCSTKRTKTN